MYTISDEYRAKESEYIRKISELEKQVAENSSIKEVVVEKKLSWFQKTLMCLGGLLTVGIIVFVCSLGFKTRKG